MASNELSVPIASKGKHSRNLKKKSLLGPLPNCTFGPKARTDSDETIRKLNPENQKLTWSKPPENILIIKRIGSETNSCFKSVSQWLIEEKKMHVYIEPKLLSDSTIKLDMDFKKIYDQLQKFNFKTTQDDKIDLIITIGGDGTLLYAASLFQDSMPPVIAFSAGSLGFLTSHYPRNYKEDIEYVLAGNANLMLRSRLRCKVERKTATLKNGLLDDQTKRLSICSSDSDDDDAKNSHLVLNEVVVNRGARQFICNLDLYLEGHRITSVQGDGLIISTPTGSTAYAVAAGASMVHPNVPSIMITPICPHSLSFRPIVVPSGAKLKFTVSDNARGTACVSFDGRDSIEIDKGDYVTVRTSVHPTPCVCKSNPFDDWFDSLSECLHWNSRQNQKGLESIDK